MFYTMLCGALRAGIRQAPENQLTPILLTNLCALLVGGFILLQLPIVIAFDSGEAYWRTTALTSVIGHTALLCCVPMFQARKRYLFARLLLVAAFVSYLFCSTLIWQSDIATPYFLLLSIFVVTFIFNAEQKYWAWLCMSVVSAVFLFLQVTAVNQRTLNDWHSLEWLTLSNQLFLLIACLLTSILCYRITCKAWHKHHAALVRSSTLLSELIPPHVANAWQRTRQCVAREHSAVTVVFADMKNFTQLAQQLDSIALVNLLDEIHRDFDNLLACYGLQKVKTNGDQYIAVAGLPSGTHEYETKMSEPALYANQACCFALAMRKLFRERCERHNLASSLRTGISSGPVVSGIIGSHKPMLDLWGNTVILASRLESQGLADNIQLDARTYQLTASQFEFMRRDHVWLKGLGFFTTYLLMDKTVDLSTDKL